VVALYKLEKTIDKERASLWKLALKLVTIVLYENENFYMFSFNWSFNALLPPLKKNHGRHPYQQHLLHLLLF
jgi:hypothetical protein